MYSAAQADLIDISLAYKPDKVLRLYFPELFEAQLHSWHRDAAKWPANRTYYMFREWFDVDVIGLVFDMKKKPPPPPRVLTLRT